MTDYQPVHPLVVLDLSAEDLAEVSAVLGDRLTPATSRAYSQIKAQTKPQRIPEPGKWGVVEARTAHSPTRRKYVSHDRNGGTPGYVWTDATSGTYFHWSDLIDPVLIREGVES